MAISHWPTAERPREKLVQKGAAALSDAELLAIFLRVGTRGNTALDLARAMLRHYGSLRALLQASDEEFCAFPGMGLAKYAQLQAALEISSRFFAEDLPHYDAISGPESCRRFVRSALASYQVEVFACLYLDTQNRVLGFEELFSGTLDCASVYPREVVRKVIAKHAAAVILCHNHPSGSERPSAADIDLTKRLSDALALIDVRVLDHFIQAGNRVVSLAELGLMPA